MVLLNREGGFHTGSRPMENCRPAIIVSFGVTAHRRPKKVLVKQESIPGRVSWDDAVWLTTIRNTSLGPCKRGPGGGDFHFLTIPLGPKCAYAFE
jgi:hypothetical protein